MTRLDLIVSRSRYSRMGQVKFLKGCLPQILLSPFINTLAHIPQFQAESTHKWISNRIILVKQILQWKHLWKGHQNYLNHHKNNQSPSHEKAYFSMSLQKTPRSEFPNSSKFKKLEKSKPEISPKSNE